MKLRTAVAPLVTAGILLALLSACSIAQQAPDRGTNVAIAGHSRVPERRDFSPELMGQLRLPPGFRINAFATGLQNPRMMAVGPDGTVYVTQPGENSVTALRDTNNDGCADQQRTVVSDMNFVHGVAVRDNRLYLAPPTRVFMADIGVDGAVGTPRILVDNLPDGGQHPNRTLAFGPDGLLYLSVGSSCNACPETNPEHATLLQINPATGQRRIYATGLRNTAGFGWSPVTGELWGLDMGSDWRGDDLPPEELNRIIDGGDYGWPWCYGTRQVDQVIAQDPDGFTREQYCERTQPAVLTYTAHASPIAAVFYTGTMFPAEYRNDLYTAMRGSWNRARPVGYKVVRIRFQDGQPAAFEDFVTGFLIEGGNAYFARISGVAQAADGALLVSDDVNGVIYRISYAGGN